MPPLHRASCSADPPEEPCLGGVTSSGHSRSGGSGTPSGIGEAVSDATDRLDVAPGAPELVAQVVDIRVDRVRASPPRRTATPGRAAGRGSASGPACRSKHSSSENSRGLRSTVAPSTVTRRAVSSRAIGPAASFGSVAGAPGAARRGRARAVARELLERERLDEVVVGAGIEPGHAVADRVARGEHQDRDARSRRRRSRRATSRPLDVRQPDVEDDALDAGCVLRDLQAAPAVGRDLHDVAIVLEQSLEERAGGAGRPRRRADAWRSAYRGTVSA